MKHPERYGLTAQWLHWSIAGLIVVQYVLAELAEEAGSMQQLVLLANHKSVGMTVLALAVVRIGWRATHATPAPVTTGWHTWMAKFVHAALYLLIFALPLSGWLMSSANAYSVSWFNLFTIPDLVNPSESLQERLKNLHHLLGNALFVLALAHIAAALKHQFWDKDAVLMRMLSLTGTLLFCVVLLAGALLLLPSQPPPPTASTGLPQVKAPIASPPSKAVTEQDATAQIPPWSIDMNRSAVTFRAEQAGAEFEGTWTDWHAEVFFDPQVLASSSATVTFNTQGVDTQDRERDETLQTAEFFATKQFPVAVFQSETITAQPEGGYVAQATLTVKGESHPITFHFDVDAAGTTLTGHAELDRLALGIGIGEWSDTTWVGQTVTVNVELWTQPNGR